MGAMNNAIELQVSVAWKIAEDYYRHQLHFELARTPAFDFRKKLTETVNFF